MNMTLSPVDIRPGRVDGLVARAGVLIFDVDGTLAETEEVHRQAFNDAFVRAGIDWRWGRTIYKELLRTAGGKERMRAFDRMRGTAPMLSDSDIAELHRIKTERYVELIANGDCPLRPGVQALLAAAKARKQRLAIATTTSRANVEALLSVALGGNWAESFDAIVAGEDAPNKKPAPDAYHEVLARLRVSASDCLAIEDSRNGLVAASIAGIPVIITRSVYFHDEDFSGALLVVDDLTRLGGG
jgi:HAD superfamily hydrolase (TIGR01509 family)